MMNRFLIIHYAGVCITAHACALNIDHMLLSLGIFAIESPLSQLSIWDDNMQSTVAWCGWKIYQDFATWAWKCCICPEVNLVYYSHK